MSDEPGGCAYAKSPSARRFTVIRERLEPVLGKRAAAAALVTLWIVRPLVERADDLARLLGGAGGVQGLARSPLFVLQLIDDKLELRGVVGLLDAPAELRPEVRLPVGVPLADPEGQATIADSLMIEAAFSLDIGDQAGGLLLAPVILHEELQRQRR
jgi:hypothetical protein